MLRVVCGRGGGRDQTKYAFGMPGTTRTRDVDILMQFYHLSMHPDTCERDQTKVREKGKDEDQETKTQHGVCPPLHPGYRDVLEALGSALQPCPRIPERHVNHRDPKGGAAVGGMEDCALAADVSCFGSRPAMVPSRLALKVSSLQIDMADPICWSGANRDIYSTWSGNSTLLCPLINQMILKREEPFNPQALALLFNPLKVSGTPRQDTQDPWALRKKTSSNLPFRFIKPPTARNHSRLHKAHAWLADIRLGHKGDFSLQPCPTSHSNQPQGSEGEKVPVINHICISGRGPTDCAP